MKRDVDGREDRYLNTERKNVRNCKPVVENDEKKRGKVNRKYKEKGRALDGLMSLT